MIKFTDVYKTYNQKRWALKKVNCKIEQGEFVYLVGKSGAGKTTFLKLLTLEEPLTRGALQIGNANLTTMTEKQLPMFRRQLGIVSQNLALLENMTVLENILYVLRATDFGGRYAKKRALEALAEVDLVDVQKKKPEELSIGQRQKVLIARAIVNQPKIILADEPTGNLDDKSAIETMRIFFRLNQKGTTVIMSTHHSTIVNTVRHRVLEINDGQIVRDQSEGSYGQPTDGRDIFYI